MNGFHKVLCTVQMTQLKCPQESMSRSYNLDNSFHWLYSMTLAAWLEGSGGTFDVGRSLPLVVLLALSSTCAGGKTGLELISIRGKTSL